MIHLDTNFLILALQSGSFEEQELLRWRSSGESVGLSAIVWAEFLCGPVSPVQMNQASNLFPIRESFLSNDAPMAAEWFNRTGRRRGSLADCMIAAVSYRVGARLATRNLADFRVFVPFGLLLA